MVLHVLTKKGKGYEAALNHPGKFHGLRALRSCDRQHCRSQALARRQITRMSSGKGLMVKLCQKDSSVVGITAAMPTGTGLKALEKAMPTRYYDVGIAEEHAVLFAARHGHDGLPARLLQFTPPSCNGPTTASCMTWRYRICR